MRHRDWRDLIAKAAANADESLLDSIALRLAECEEAFALLRRKGYGQSGTSIVHMARAVPDAQ